MTGISGLRSRTSSRWTRTTSPCASWRSARTIASRLYRSSSRREEIEYRRQEFRDYLGYLVRLRDPDRCAAPADIRWEIINACAVEDYSRALSLCDLLKDILPAPVAQYHCGRPQFLVALLPTLDIEQGLQYWDLTLGKPPDGLRGIWQCVNVGNLYSASIERFPTTCIRRESPELSSKVPQNRGFRSRFVQQSVDS